MTLFSWGTLRVVWQPARAVCKRWLENREAPSTYYCDETQATLSLVMHTLYKIKHCVYVAENPTMVLSLRGRPFRQVSVRVFRLFLSSTFLRHSHDCVVAKRSLSWALPVQTAPARGLQTRLAAAGQMGNVCACGEVVVIPTPPSP